jgi:hypothetical protein
MNDRSNILTFCRQSYHILANRFVHLVTQATARCSHDHSMFVGPDARHDHGDDLRSGLLMPAQPLS